MAQNISKDFQEEDDVDWIIRLVGAFYPSLQIINFNTPSYIKYGEGPGILHKTDVIRHHLYHLFGHANASFIQKLSDNLHTSEAMKSSDKASMLDINLIPYSFRDYHPPDWIHTAEDKKLSAHFHDLILDYRLSPMLVDDKDLTLLPPTYFIAPEFDPMRDESFMFYGRIREMDMSSTDHVYHKTEQHGFLTDIRTSNIANKALTDFVDKFLKRCNYQYYR